MLWDGAYGFSSLSEKTRKSNHLQMSLQREDFLLSYLKTLSVDPVGIWTREPRSADRRSPNRANQAAVSPGGALGYFLGGYVPPETQNWHPVLKKFPLNWHPVLQMGQFFIARSRISPETDTPF